MTDTKILGVDVWSGYGTIDWAKVAASGIRFVYVRATGAVGANGRDSHTARNLAGARAAGLAVGVYHVWRHTQDPVTAADAAFEHGEGTGHYVGDLAPALDCELPAAPVAKPGQNQAALSAKWAAEMLALAPVIVPGMSRAAEAFERRFGRAPTTYSYPFWLLALGAALRASDLAQLQLWIAQYSNRLPWDLPATLEEIPMGMRPKIPLPWTSAPVWQYSAEHSRPVPGIPTAPCRAHPDCTAVDRNVFLGSEADFARFRGMVPVEPAPLLEGGIVHGTHVVDAALAERESDEPARI